MKNGKKNKRLILKKISKMTAEEQNKMQFEQNERICKAFQYIGFLKG